VNFEKLDLNDFKRFASKTKNNAEYILRSIDDILAFDDSYYGETNDKM